MNECIFYLFIYEWMDGWMMFVNVIISKVSISCMFFYFWRWDYWANMGENFGVGGDILLGYDDCNIGNDLVLMSLLKITFIIILKVSMLTNQQSSPDSQSQRQQCRIQHINQLYKKTQKVWNCEIEQTEVQSLSIAYANQIKYEAENGNPKACFLLGRSYGLGYAVQKSNKLSIKWFQQAQKLGECHSIFNLAYFEDDSQLKKVLLQQGADKLEIRSIYKVAAICLSSDQLDKHQRAYNLMNKLFELSYVEADYLGWLILKRRRSPHYDKQKAVSHLKAYHKKANINKIWELYYGYELYQTEDLWSAIDTLKQVYCGSKEIVTQQNGKIQHIIGKCYQKLDKNNEAKEWYKKGIIKNYLPCFTSLAWIYSNENEAELEKQILHKGMKVDHKAKQRESTLSLLFHNLAVTYNRSNNSEEEYRFHYEGARHYDWDSYARCGKMLYDGDGVNKDTRKGKKAMMEGLENKSTKAKAYQAIISEQN